MPEFDRSTGQGSSAQKGAESGGEESTTPPTPNYLIPKMGELPVSSTVRYQTVVMDEMSDHGDAASMWKAIREPVLHAIRGYGNELIILRAIAGDVPATMNDAPLTDHQSPIDVTDQLETLFADPFDGVVHEKSIQTPHRRAGDRLRIEYAPAGSDDGRIITRDYRDGDRVAEPEFEVLQAVTSGDVASATADQSLGDATAFVRSLVENGRLEFVVGDDRLPFAEGVSNPKVRIVWTSGGRKFDETFQEGESVSLGLAEEIVRATFGAQPPVGTVDLTDHVRGHVGIDRLDLKVSPDRFPARPAGSPVPSQFRLRVDYLAYGARHVAYVAPDERLYLNVSEMRPTERAIRRSLFEPVPESVVELAARLFTMGVTAKKVRSAEPAAIEGEEAPVIEDDSDSLDLADWIADRMEWSSDGRFDPVASASHDALSEPAFGAVLYHEQGWYVRGLALGNLLHSVALAPGEVTQIAVSNWSHATRATEDELVTQLDSTTAADTRARSITEVQNASVRERAWGNSNAETTATSRASASSSFSAKGRLGFFGSVKGSAEGTSNSFGSAHNVSSVVTRSGGDKDVAMAANQSINDTTNRHAEAVRSKRAATVREVTQTENQQVTTRVIANYNHMHALTMMYFEVIEVYSLRTRVVDAERVVFMPFVVRDVVDLVPRYGAVLIEAANAAERPDLAEAIAYYREGLHDAQIQSNEDGTRSAEPLTLAADILDAEEKLKQARDNLESREADLASQSEVRKAKRDAALSKLDELQGKRADIVSSMSTFERMNPVFARLATQAIRDQLKPLEVAMRRAEGDLKAISDADQRDLERLHASVRRARRAVARRRQRLDVLLQTRRTVRELVERSNQGPFHENRLFFNQAVWLTLSPSEVLGMARSFRLRTGLKFADELDPTPVSVSGNYIGYRWPHSDATKQRRYKAQWVQPWTPDAEMDPASILTDIAVPTGGVFGEAVLGQAVSAEKIDLTRFWNWQDSMIPILPTGINPVTMATPKMQDLDPRAQGLDESSAKLQPMQDLPAPSGFGALAGTLQAQMFRDMSGQSVLQTLAESATKAAAESEQNAADIASNNLAAGFDFMKDMAGKALQAAAASSTGGGSMLGSLVAKKSGGGASVLGGVLNASDGAGRDRVLDHVVGKGADLAVGAASQKRDGDAPASSSDGDGTGEGGTETDDDDDDPGRAVRPGHGTDIVAESDREPGLDDDFEPV